MSEILLLEDLPDVREQVCKDLTEAFDDVQIDCARFEQEAIEKIGRSQQLGQPYQIAVIDFAVPATQSANPEISFRTYHEFRRASPRGDIIYLTAYANYEQVRKHIDEACSKVGEPRPAVIRKSADPTWPRQLLDAICPMVERLLRERIERNFNDLFPAATGALNAAERARRPGVRHRDVTHAIAAFRRDVERHWDILPERLREGIQRVFLVQTHDEKVELVLAPEHLRSEQE